MIGLVEECPNNLFTAPVAARPLGSLNLIGKFNSMENNEVWQKLKLCR